LRDENESKLKAAVKNGRVLVRIAKMDLWEEGKDAIVSRINWRIWKHERTSRMRAK